jgi:hypothetical protein
VRSLNHMGPYRARDRGERWDNRQQRQKVQPTGLSEFERLMALVQEDELLTRPPASLTLIEAFLGEVPHTSMGITDEEMNLVLAQVGGRLP